MRMIRKYYFFPLLLFIALLVDGQMTFTLSHYLPTNFQVISFLFLYGFLILSLYFSDLVCIWLGIFFGFCFDVYFLKTVGIAFMLFPIFQLCYCKLNQIFLVNRLTRFLTVLVSMILFLVASAVLEQLLLGVQIDWITYIVFEVAPSLFWNGFCLLIFQLLLEKIYL